MCLSNLSTCLKSCIIVCRSIPTFFAFLSIQYVCLSVHPVFCLPVCLSVNSQASISVCLSLPSFPLPACLAIWRSTCLYVHPVCLFVRPCSFLSACLYVHLVCLFTRPFRFLSACLSVCLSIQYVCLSAFVSWRKSLVLLL